MSASVKQTGPTKKPAFKWSANSSAKESDKPQEAAQVKVKAPCKCGHAAHTPDSCDIETGCGCRVYRPTAAV